jgi:hypothetical protein
MYNGARNAGGSWHSTDQQSQPWSRLGPTPYSSSFPQRTTMQPAVHAASPVPSGSSSTCTRSGMMRPSAPVASLPAWVHQSSSHPAPPPAAYIPLEKPLNSNYTIPRRAPVLDPPVESMTHGPRFRQQHQQQTASSYNARGVAARDTPQTPAGAGITPTGTLSTQPSNLQIHQRNRLCSGRLGVRTSLASHLLKLSGTPSQSSGRSAKASWIGAKRSSAHAQSRQAAHSPHRQLGLLTGLHDNLPATLRGLTPKVSLYT